MFLKDLWKNGGKALLVLLVSLNGIFGNSEQVNHFGAALDEFQKNLAKKRLASLSKHHQSLRQWLERRDLLVRQIRDELGLEKESPEFKSKTFLAKTLSFPDYEIQNLAFLSPQNRIITGNLYRSLRPGKKPAILSPPDHADQGRFDPEVQIRCAMLAKAGAVVFTWDMLGWGESLGEHESPFSKGIQLQNSLAVVDFLVAMPEVDANRIGFSASSGGAIQGLLLGAVDQRVSVLSLVSMISSLSMGHCPCEIEGFYYRRGDFFTDHSEISALIAPRPLQIISNGKDWTRFFPELGALMIQSIYDLFEKGNQFDTVHFPDEGHDFGRLKRLEVCRFFAKHLNLTPPKTIHGTNPDEKVISILKRNELQVFDSDDIRKIEFGTMGH
jgi:uncharacterized protein